MSLSHNNCVFLFQLFVFKKFQDFSLGKSGKMVRYAKYAMNLMVLAQYL